MAALRGAPRAAREIAPALTYVMMAAEADFQRMAQLGINAVRIPLGYWLLATTEGQALPFVERGFQSLDKCGTLLLPMRYQAVCHAHQTLFSVKT